MPIPFPKIHIAESVLNRIQNTLDGDGPLGLTVMQPPIVPDPLASGLGLDAALSQQPPPATLSPQAEDSAATESVLGGSPFDGALLGV